MALEVEHLSYTYPKSAQPVLNDVSFTAPDGVVTSLIGANGVGKSTLIKSILGLCPGAGRVRFNGAENAGLSKKVGYMTQQGVLSTTLKVLEVVLLGRMQTLGFRVDGENLDRAWNIIKLLRLEPLAQRPYNTLSGGQQRVVGLAQTLVREPELLLLDEPTANLDMQNELEVMALVRAYTRQRSIATLVTLHDLNAAARFSDKLVLLKDGAVYREGTPVQVITEDAIRAAYGVEAHVHTDRAGRTMLYPLRSVREQSYHFDKEVPDGTTGES